MLTRLRNPHGQSKGVSFGVFHLKRDPDLTLKKLGIPACPECQREWKKDDNFLDPIQENCGHIKCRKCFTWRLNFASRGRDSCPQCHTFQIIPECPECGLAWNEQKDCLPIQEKCGHFKCRRCYKRNFTSLMDPCQQCSRTGQGAKMTAGILLRRRNYIRGSQVLICISGNVLKNFNGRKQTPQIISDKENVCTKEAAAKNSLEFIQGDRLNVEDEDMPQLYPQLPMPEEEDQSFTDDDMPIIDAVFALERIKTEILSNGKVCPSSIDDLGSSSAQRETHNDSLNHFPGPQKEPTLIECSEGTTKSQYTVNALNDTELNYEEDGKEKEIHSQNNDKEKQPLQLSSSAQNQLNPVEDIITSNTAKGNELCSALPEAKSSKTQILEHNFEIDASLLNNSMKNIEIPNAEFSEPENLKIMEIQPDSNVKGLQISTSCSQEIPIGIKAMALNDDKKEEKTLSNFKEMETRECPECACDWNNMDHRPIEVKCGHTKCKHCFMLSLANDSGFCLQCNKDSDELSDDAGSSVHTPEYSPLTSPEYFLDKDMEELHDIKSKDESLTLRNPKTSPDITVGHVKTIRLRDLQESTDDFNLTSGTTTAGKTTIVNDGSEEGLENLMETAETLIPENHQQKHLLEISPAHDDSHNPIIDNSLPLAEINLETEDPLRFKSNIVSDSGMDSGDGLIKNINNISKLFLEEAPSERRKPEGNDFDIIIASCPNSESSKNSLKSDAIDGEINCGNIDPAILASLNSTGNSEDHNGHQTSIINEQENKISSTPLSFTPGDSGGFTIGESRQGISIILEEEFCISSTPLVDASANVKDSIEQSLLNEKDTLVHIIPLCISPEHSNQDGEKIDVVNKATTDSQVLGNLNDNGENTNCEENITTPLLTAPEDLINSAGVYSATPTPLESSTGGIIGDINSGDQIVATLERSESTHVRTRPCHKESTLGETCKEKYFQTCVENTYLKAGPVDSQIGVDSQSDLELAKAPDASTNVDTNPNTIDAANPPPINSVTAATTNSPIKNSQSSNSINIDEIIEDKSVITNKRDDGTCETNVSVPNPEQFVVQLNTNTASQIKNITVENTPIKRCSPPKLSLECSKLSSKKRKHASPEPGIEDDLDNSTVSTKRHCPAPQLSSLSSPKENNGGLPIDDSCSQDETENTTEVALIRVRPLVEIVDGPEISQDEILTVSKLTEEDFIKFHREKIFPRKPKVTFKIPLLTNFYSSSHSNSEDTILNESVEKPLVEEVPKKLKKCPECENPWDSEDNKPVQIILGRMKCTSCLTNYLSSGADFSIQYNTESSSDAITLLNQYKDTTGSHGNEVNTEICVNPDQAKYQNIFPTRRLENSFRTPSPTHKDSDKQLVPIGSFAVRKSKPVYENQYNYNKYLQIQQARRYFINESVLAHYRTLERNSSVHDVGSENANMDRDMVEIDPLEID